MFTQQSADRHLSVAPARDAVGHRSPLSHREAADPDQASQAEQQHPFTFRLLGTLEYWRDDRPVEIRGVIQRTLLAALLSAASWPVPTASLIEELWGENPPLTAENSLQAHVSRLRRKLGTSRGTQGVRLLNLPSGYQLLVPQTDIDAFAFMNGIKTARLLKSTDPGRASAELRAALSLWRGPVFGGPLGGRLCQATATRYQAARSTALELLFDLELQCGRHSEAIPELSEMVEASSLDERMCEHLMVALYRAGRQTEALDTFRRVRARLDDELGVEPSPTLRRIEQAILNHDPLLYQGSDYAALRA